MAKFEKVNTSRCKLPRLPLLRLKEDILGKEYELSLAFVDEKTSQILNNKHRKKNYPTNVLSFELEKTSGEIMICPKVARREAKKFDKTYRQFLGFLAIHGMLHLKGMSHGKGMEEKEDLFFKKHFSRAK
jgi:rRNA maturation RNase YbeY